LSTLHSTFSPLALDFTLDICCDDTHPQCVRTQHCGPHNDSVKFLTLGHWPYCIRCCAACCWQYHLEVCLLLFPTYLPWHIEYLSHIDFTLHIKTLHLASSRCQATVAQLPLLFFCVLSTNWLTTSQACWATVVFLIFTSLCSCLPSLLSLPSFLAIAIVYHHHHHLLSLPSSLTIPIASSCQCLKILASINANTPTFSLPPVLTSCMFLLALVLSHVHGCLGIYPHAYPSVELPGFGGEWGNDSHSWPGQQGGGGWAPNGLGCHPCVVVSPSSVITKCRHQVLWNK